MMFLAVSTPRPLIPTINIFILMSFPIVSIPKVPICLEYKLVSTFSSVVAIFIYINYLRAFILKAFWRKMINF